MKKTLSIIAFLIVFLSFPQNTGKIEYGLYIELNQESEDFFKELKGAEGISMDEGTKKLSFVLEFINANSKFYIVESIKTKDLDAKMAISWSGYDNITYLNTTEKTIYYNNKKSMLFSKNEFVIEKNIFDSWELKNEKKEIQGFICYKAVGFIIDKLNNDKKTDITAWYCPELPFSFGPNGYGGLPGLILELQVGDVLFGATKISLNEKIEDIDSTKLKGKKITAEEYSKILRERAGIIMEGR